MLKVVLIDDKKSIVEGMKYLIEWEQYGFEIAAALRCAADAVSFTEQNHVDLIISDIRMPGMSGLELIEEIRKIDPRVKFIIMSGYAEFEYAKKALDYQANGYLLKPVDEDELIGLLQRVKNEIHDENKYVKHQRDKHIQKLLSGDIENEFNDKSFENDAGLRYVLYGFLMKKSLFRVLKPIIPKLLKKYSKCLIILSVKTILFMSQKTIMGLLSLLSVPLFTVTISKDIA